MKTRIPISTETWLFNCQVEYCDMLGAPDTLGVHGLIVWLILRGLPLNAQALARYAMGAGYDLAGGESGVCSSPKHVVPSPSASHFQCNHAGDLGF